MIANFTATAQRPQMTVLPALPEVFFKNQNLAPRFAGGTSGRGIKFPDCGRQEETASPIAFILGATAMSQIF